MSKRRLTTKPRPAPKDFMEFVQSLSPGQWDDAQLLARLKCEKQLRSMVAGARATGKDGEVHLLSLALLFRLFSDLKRSWRNE